MADIERNLPDPSPGGVPDIPPEVIEAFKNVSPDLDQTYNDAKQNHATIIAWLQTEAERRRLSAEQKRGFMLGALSVMGLFDFDKVYSSEIAPLERLFQQAAYIDDQHTDPPLTA